MSTKQQKVFSGPRLRLLRKEMELTQATMAAELGISASYLNLLESNQRPLTAQLLLKLAETYDIDLRSLTKSYDAEVFSALNEVFSDPLMRPFMIPKSELQEIANISPSAAEAIAKLYANYLEYQDRILASTHEQSTQAADLIRTEMRQPMDDVHEFLHANNNYFETLDDAASQLHNEIVQSGTLSAGDLKQYLSDHHSIKVSIMPPDVMMGTLRRYDRHRNRLMISELLHAPGQRFQIAFQVVSQSFNDLIDDALSSTPLLSENSLPLARIALLNYITGALLMPYDKFYTFIEKHHYDLELTSSHFGASLEQVCHRLTTLQKPKQSGVPFYMIRVDNAGNISKRFSNNVFPISRYGGSCPLWNVHNTFQAPGKFLVQVVEMPDGGRFLSVARTISRAHKAWDSPPIQRAISIGCRIEDADKLIYAKGLDLTNPIIVPVGTNCSLCERTDCEQRARPPLSKKLIIDESKRGVSSYSF